MTRRSFRAKNYNSARVRVREINAFNRKHRPGARALLVSTVKLSQVRRDGDNYYSAEISAKKKKRK